MDWKALVPGAACFVPQLDGGVMPCRFSRAQMERYAAADESYRVRSVAASGLWLECETTATAMELEAAAIPGSSQDIWAFDLEVNGRLFAHREGSFQKEPHILWQQTLPSGNKWIRLYFPCLAGISIHRLFFSNGEVKPIRVEKRLLCLGDSITQGYTVHFPSHAYAAALAAKPGTALTVQAIGGETFHAAMFDDGLPFAPDLITVAYGTNDWTCRSKEDFYQRSEEYLTAVRRKYPETPMVVISPVWRADWHAHPGRFPFEDIGTLLLDVAKSSHSILIFGKDLLPAIPELFMPDGVHPNDIGHCLMGKNLMESLSHYCEKY